MGLAPPSFSFVYSMWVVFFLFFSSICGPSCVSSLCHLPQRMLSSPLLPTFSLTHIFTAFFVLSFHGFLSLNSAGIIFNHLLALVLHDFLIQTDIFSSSSLLTFFTLGLPCLSLVAIFSINPSCLPTCITFMACSIVAFAATCPMSNHHHHHHHHTSPHITSHH